MYGGTAFSLPAGGGGGVITALDDATENEMVTISATTTALQAEPNMTIDSGKMGIGVTYPTHPLNVFSGQASGALGPGIAVKEIEIDAANYSGFFINEGAERMNVTTDAQGTGATNHMFIEVEAGRNITMATTGVQNIMTCQSSAGESARRVMIGNNAAILSKFHVHDSTNGELDLILLENKRAHAGGQDTHAMNIRFAFSTEAAAGTGHENAKIKVGKEQDYTSDGNKDSFMSFSIDRGATLTERMRLTSDGINVSSLPTEDPEVVGDLWVNDGNAFALTVSQGSP